MSGEESPNCNGVYNNGMDADEMPAMKKSESTQRFRISKLPADDEVDMASAAAKNGNGPPAESDGLKMKGIGIEEEGQEESEKSVKEDSEAVTTKEKHVHMNLPENFNDTHHDTHHQTHHQTMGYLTHDAVPLSVFYRNQDSMENVAAGDKRPTLDQLHKGEGLENAKKRHWDASKTVEPVRGADIETAPNANARPVTKLGWIKGVLFPTLLNIWGVILFLRMPWIVASAGIGLSTVVVLLATVVTTITAVSMSAVCTNGEVKGGGAYFLISRSLGPEFGGSIGVIFSVANAVAVALYLVGFGETVQKMLANSDITMAGAKNDVRIIGLIALVFIFFVTQIGLDWVIHTQSGLLAFLAAAMISVIAGTAYPNPQKSREYMELVGLPGYKGELFTENFGPEYEDGIGFFDVFSIFFPAATGIMAGANLSGDLKDPSKAVPLGTLLAIAMTSVVYILLCWLLGSSTMRYAVGPSMEAAVTTAATNVTSNVTTTIATTVAKALTDTKYGAIKDLQLMEKISLWGPLVLIGIFAATLSSALASLVSAPKVFQAVCKDKIFPGIEIFGKGYGRNKEPRNGYFLTLVIAAGFTAIGDLNVIAPIISNFFLMAYALVNYAVFASSLSKSPGWRPSFKYYNMWISFIGFLLCLAIMFLINWWAALITLLAVAALYKWVDIRKPDINWGSSGQAHTFLKALRLTRRLDDTADHVKNFRIQCLCLTGQPSLRPNLVHFASHITKHLGLLVCGEIVLTDKVSQTEQQNESKWLTKHKIKAFHQIVQNPTLRGGVNAMLQASGLGKLRPNTLLVGYMNRWQTAKRDKVDEFYSMLHDAFDMRYGVGILRLQDGFDITDGVYDEEIEEDGMVDNQEPDWYTEDWDENQKQTGDIGNGSDNTSEQESKGGLRKKSQAPPPTIVMAFDKDRKGYIDVWWLYDDGGLTILLPHLLSLSSHWRGCKLRILTPASEKKIKANQIRMANLLKKFRIDFSSVVEFRGIGKHPRDDSITHFRRMRRGEHLDGEEVLDKKTLRQIRLGELLHEHSSEAKLIVLTLPIPKKSTVSSLMYMSWLEVLSADLPPMLMVRGNQTSVLTFYS